MKETLKLILSKSKILKPFDFLQQDKIVIFNYHRISDIDQFTHFDEDLFGPNKDRFRQEMEWIKKKTRVLSEEELVEIVYSKKTIKETCSMVTFDDGYRDNFDIAFPILKELNMSATFFIPTCHILERKVGWWDIVAYLLKNTSLNCFTFQNNEYEMSDVKSVIKKIIVELKSTDADEVDGFLLKLSETLCQSFPSKEMQSSELMTWEQIKILSDNGMTIGTHGHDHSICSRQNVVRLKNQLEKSIKILEEVIDKKINSIAYPVGGYNHFNDDTKNVSRNLDLKLGFSYLTGVNQWGKIDPFNVKRMIVKPEWINLDMPLAFPNIFLKCQNQ